MLALALTFVLLVIAPSLGVLFTEGVEGEVALSFLHYALVYLLVLSVTLVLQRILPKQFIRVLFSLVATTYGLLLTFLAGYLWYTGGTFDLFFLLDSWEDALPTSIGIFGSFGLLALVALFALLTLSSYILFSRALYRLEAIEVRRGRILAGSALMLLSLVLVPHAEGSVFDQVDHVREVTVSRRFVVPSVPDNSAYEVASDESVFVLQLESLNALAVNGAAVVDGVPYPGNHIPVMRKVARDGVYVPYLWGNAVQTNRGQESILCGIALNLADAFSYTPEEIGTPCLPAILRDTGYETVFLSAYDDGGFFNLQEFVEHIGFEDARHADFMQEGDLYYSWGYDDCAFYERAFEYLGKAYDPEDPQFVYFEATSHHMPFPHREEYAFLEEYKEPQNYIEKYLNSARAQDYCVGKFYDLFKEYTGGNAHLVVVSDHSWPVGINGNTYNERNAFNDNFLVPLAYIPPKDRRDEFRIGEEVEARFSQSDLLPTIVELLNRTSQPNSFAFAFQRDAKAPLAYEDCHVLSQPYGGSELAVVRGDRKLIYDVEEQEVTSFNLADDLLEQHPEVLASDVPYENFLEQELCDRYRGEVVAVASMPLWEGSAHIGDQVNGGDWSESYWEDFIEAEPLDTVRIPFVLEPGTILSHLELHGADLEVGNQIFLNGERIGGSCSTGRKRWHCVVELDHPITIKDRANVLEIQPKDTGGGNLDDFVLFEVRSFIQES